MARARVACGLPHAMRNSLSISRAASLSSLSKQQRNDAEGVTVYKIDYSGIFGDIGRGCTLLIVMVGERGFEPPTPWSRTRCSTRLSHSPTSFAECARGPGLVCCSPLDALGSSVTDSWSPAGARGGARGTCDQRAELDPFNGSSSLRSRLRRAPRFALRLTLLLRSDPGARRSTRVPHLSEGMKGGPPPSGLLVERVFCPGPAKGYRHGETTGEPQH